MIAEIEVAKVIRYSTPNHNEILLCALAETPSLSSRKAAILNAKKDGVRCASSASGMSAGHRASGASLVARRVNGAPGRAERHGASHCPAPLDCDGGSSPGWTRTNNPPVNSRLERGHVRSMSHGYATLGAR